MIPSVSECFELIEQHRMLDNIRDHTVVVANIAALIVEGVNRAGGELSMPLAVGAALLHDIGKTACLDNDDDHAKLGREICIENGYEEVGGIVGDHVRLLKSNLPEVTENEVVFYADKRVNHDSVVSLDEREIYIIERYGRRIPERIEVIKENCLKWRVVERYIFSFLDFQPDELADVLGQGSLVPDIARTIDQNSAIYDNNFASDI